MSMNQPVFENNGSHPLSQKAVEREPCIGTFIKRWRERRHLSQKELASAASVSCRHISFIETGRSKPSRKMILRLCEVLDLPYRSRNSLLNAGGFKPAFTETDFSTSGFAGISNVLNTILGRQEPNPSVVLDGHWNVVRCNESARKLLGLLLGETPCQSKGERNLIRRLANEPELRAAITNWNEVAIELIRRLHRKIETEGADRLAQSLIDDIIETIDPAERCQLSDARQAGRDDLAVPICIRRSGMTMNFYAITTRFSAPRDITVQELRVESLHPACSDTEEALKFLQISRL